MIGRGLKGEERTMETIIPFLSAAPSVVCESDGVEKSGHECLLRRRTFEVEREQAGEGVVGGDVLGPAVGGGDPTCA